MRLEKRLGLMLLACCVFTMGSMQIAQAGPYKAMTLHYGGLEFPSLYPPVFYPEGFIFQDTTLPDQATDAEISRDQLKRGEAEIINILHLVELGDGSITAAAKNGGITKVHYVENEPFKVNLWYLFFKRQKTVVYGE